MTTGAAAQKSNALARAVVLKVAHVHSVLRGARQYQTASATLRDLYAELGRPIVPVLGTTNIRPSLARAIEPEEIRSASATEAATPGNGLSGDRPPSKGEGEGAQALHPRGRGPPKEAANNGPQDSRGSTTPRSDRVLGMVRRFENRGPRSRDSVRHEQVRHALAAVPPRALGAA